MRKWEKGEYNLKGEFKLRSAFKPTGDQPKAIESLTDGILSGMKHQTLLGITGSGKTFTMANVINRVQRPTLVIAHNKTLAAQLCSEFREFFPENAVEYFVSYYDYYQPEAYLPATDTYIDKDASINEEIDKLRHSATASLLERRDVIIVASVSCIYGLGDPEDYTDLMISLRPGMNKDRDEIIEKLVDIQYERRDIDFKRSSFRARGDVLEVFPSYSSENALRIEFFGDEIEKISEINSLTGEILGTRNHVAIFPASHYATSREKMKAAVVSIEAELEERLEDLKLQGKLIEAYRLEQRTRYDMELLEETGFCPGIENYSRHISGRDPGSPPFTLIDYFPEDYLLIIDESHMTIPQIGAMYNGDRSRKEALVEYGFRLPSAFDNRPLKFSEFEEKVNQVVYVSATPAKYERSHSTRFVEQLIRPTGLVDPEIKVRPVANQIDDLITEIRAVISKRQRVLVTTLTKRMAEELSDYLDEAGFKVKYLHSGIETIERMEIIRDLRQGAFDILVGINLLREGLDLPEVSMVAILDADKEGFLRSETALIQTIGRAARNAEGRVIMYADTITESMERAIKETERRRVLQMEYNKIHGIIPKTVEKGIRNIIEAVITEDNLAEEKKSYRTERKKGSKSSRVALHDKKHMPVVSTSESEEIPEEKLIEKLTAEMKRAARELDFERAAALRDSIKNIKEKQKKRKQQ